MRILIVRNNYNPKALEASILLEAFFDKQNIEYQTYECDDLRPPHVIIDQDAHDGEPPFDLAVVLGGDGTILCTAGQIRTQRIPILGINFGNLGFMANPNDEGVISIVSAALAGDATCEARTNLRIEVYCEEDALGTTDQEESAQHAYPLSCEPILKESAGTPQQFFALNEMVIARGDQGRMIHFKYRISDSLMADMRSDGLIVASATGSTGYALSAGGPLIDPSYKGLVAVPIAPHTLQSRAVVTGSSDVVEIDLDTSPASRAATLFIDGERIRFDSPIRKVVISTGDEPTLLLRYQAKPFYQQAADAFFKG
jgi:NAD+ kinase